MIVFRSPAAVLLAALVCAASAAGAAAPGPGVLLDTQIAAFLDLGDQEAHDQAYAILQRGGGDPGVTAFAQLVIADRLRSARSRASIPNSQPAYDELSLRRRREVESAAARLKTLRGKELDRAYLAFTIEQLQRELDDIDKRFALEVSEPRLAAHLRERRYLLAEHLEKARALRAKP